MMLRNRISSVYDVSAMIAVVLPRPVIGSSRKKTATLGSVYRMPVTWMIGGTSQRRRWASSARPKATAKPIATETTVR